MVRSRRESRHRDGITDQKSLQPTSATKSAKSRLMHRNKFMRTGNSFAALTVNANLYEAKKFSCLGHLGQKGQSVL